MSIALVVNGNTFLYPTNRQSPSWGEQATAWAQAVTEVLNTLQGTDDIPLTTATISNNVTDQSIVGLNFDPTQSRGAIITYSVNRFTDGVGGVERAEVGYIYATYIASTTTWTVVVAGSGTAGISFGMTSLGQVTYTTDLQDGDNYNGTIVFKASALPVVI